MSHLRFISVAVIQELPGRKVHLIGISLAYGPAERANHCVLGHSMVRVSSLRY